MPLFEINKNNIVPVAATSFKKEGIEERRDLQRLLREHIEVIGVDLLVIGEEFGDWEESQRRIDLLAVDKQANLVVIELKRTEDGGHADLQAVRYAAMVSAMTFEQAVDAYSRLLRTHGSADDAQTRLLSFLEWDEPDDELFAQDVRIIVVSADFSKEVTTSVLWLNGHGLDIRCFRLKPYRLADRIVVDAEQIIPLKEAEEYQVRVREKSERERSARTRRVHEPWTGFYYVNIAEGKHRSWEDCRNYGYVCAGGGTKYSDPLKVLQPGDSVYVYARGCGYVGSGVVEGPAIPAKDFVVVSAGKRLFDLPLVQDGVKTRAEDPELAEWVVPIHWNKTVSLKEGKTFKGVFANQNVVCKLRHPETLKFLEHELGAEIQP